MDTNRIKKFATEARNVLKTGVAAKLQTLGFKKDGSVSEDMMPRLFQGGCIWNGRPETEGFYHRWMSLYERVQRKGLNEVYEEVAYTWFNRFVAIRILRKNGLAEPVLDFVDSANTPRIVDQARSGQIPQMNEEDRRHLVELLDDDTKTTEQFALLMTAWCHNNPIISKCFGSIADYTEILLPNNILVEGGFIDMLNHTEFITDEDFTSPELIGWLYQFYISERKDEVFAKKGKFEADEIPAATQIFTPNWIVKYMVQNTVGRIYLDNNPYDTALKSNWKYLVEGEPTPQDSIYKYNELTDLKVADLACGSGHILNECFDLLYELYIHEGYTRGEAIENIFNHNLTGVDLDKRAQQLSIFALLLKACQKDRSYADAHCMPHVLTMPKAWDDEKNGSTVRAVSAFLQGNETGKMMLEMNEAMKLMKDADSLGSIMKFEISDSTRLALLQAMEYWKRNSYLLENVTMILPYVDLILTLTEKYSGIVMNPPYMSCSKLNDTVMAYVEKYYPLTRHDLCTVFMDVSYHLLSTKGKFGMINQFPWTSKTSYTEYRQELSNSITINTLLDLGTSAFPEMSGEVINTVTFIISKQPQESCGCFYNLQKESGLNKELLFLTNKNRYHKFSIKDTIYFPENKLLYWLSSHSISHFHSNSKVKDIAVVKKGIATGKDSLFLKLWSEVNFGDIDFKRKTLAFGKKWIPINKGGGYRKWSGNREYIVNWENDGEEIKNYRDNNGKLLSRPQNLHYMLLEGNVYNIISSNDRGFIGRYNPPYMMSTDVSPYVHSEDELYSDKYLLGYLNSAVGRHFINILAPSYKVETGSVGQVPFVKIQKPEIDKIVTENINISTEDWNAHETSWDFQENELIKLQKDGLGTITAGWGETTAMKYSTLNLLYAEYVAKWDKVFRELHANEEELNRQFIEIYGLQDELTPDVPLDEVTILQQGEIKHENNEIKFQADVVMKQLISYAIGCWMGRYRLDVPGLHIGHPNPTKEEVCTYEYYGESFTIDNDGIIPLLPYDCPFDDNLQTRVADFVRIAFGADSLAENLNFIEQSLGCTIEKYLDKDYWKDHKKMYQNRPIYWLWSSKKGAFRVLTYMHRMDAYTAERVRSKYLLPYIEFLQNKINDLENRTASLSTADSRKLDNYRKILEECREYHERLQVVAEQAIGFDLDDGVVENYAKFGDVLSKIK